MRPNLLLLHGALGSTAQLLPLIPKLESHFRVFCVPFSGHGGIPPKSAYAIEAFAAEVEAFMDANGMESAHCFGYSMGGYVALFLAARQADRLEKIMTLGTKLDWNPETAAREAAMLNPEKVEAKVPAFAAMLAQRHAPLDWKDVMRSTAQLLTDLGNGRPSLQNDFPAIPNSVQLCLGSADNMVSREETERAAQQLPNARLKIIEGFKHPIEQVDPDQLAAEIILFLQPQAG